LQRSSDIRHKRGHDLGLTDDEFAFYDALAANESAAEEELKA
jgi:type I restriction enzyme R subunit